MARADKGMGRGDSGPKGTEHVGDHDPDEALDTDDLQEELKGRNKLQGNDQLNVRDQRHAQAMVNKRTEGVVESFRRNDPKERG